MSVFGFKGLGWFLCGVIVAPACYMVTSAGAAERARLQSLDAKIVAAQKDIRSLETEYNARANMVQLQQWNGEALQLAAPAPQQFLASETQLAQLDAFGADEVQLAALVVPAAAPRAAPQPAVLTREGPLKDKGAEAVASNEAGKARTVAVAMLDGKLLSSDMEKELRQLAAAEQLKLR